MHPMLASSFIFIFFWGVSLTHTCGLHFLFGEFLLHIPCWLHFYWERFFYTSRAGFFSSSSFYFILYIYIYSIWGVSLTHPTLALFLSREFLLHIPRLLYFSLGSSLTHPMLASIFLFHLGNFSYTSRAGFIFIWGVSLTHPMLASFFSWGGGGGGIWGASLAHSLLPSFLYGECLLHIPYWLHYYLGIFSYISHAGFIFIWGVSLTHPVLDLFFMQGISLTHSMLP